MGVEISNCDRFRKPRAVEGILVWSEVNGEFGGHSLDVIKLSAIRVRKITVESDMSTLYPVGLATKDYVEGGGCSD
jgi:hypothetical protein